MPGRRKQVSIKFVLQIWSVSEKVYIDYKSFDKAEEVSIFVTETATWESLSKFRIIERRVTERVISELDKSEPVV